MSNAADVLQLHSASSVHGASHHVSVSRLDSSCSRNLRQNCQSCGGHVGSRWMKLSPQVVNQHVPQYYATGDGGKAATVGSGHKHRQGRGSPRYNHDLSTTRLPSLEIVWGKQVVSSGTLFGPVYTPSLTHFFELWTVYCIRDTN